MIYLRALDFRPSTLDPEAGTVEAVVSTGADVRRGDSIERLDLGGADLSRLIGGPVLDAHRQGSTRDVLGGVEDARREGGAVVARIRFRTSPEAQAALHDIGGGTLRGLSLGYNVEKWEERREGGKRIRIAREWSPREVSLVPVPADPGAHFRAGGPEMADDTEIETQEAPPRMTRAEANMQIRSIAKTAGLGQGWIDAQIDAEAAPEAARAAAWEAMQTRNAATRVQTQRVQVTHSNDNPAAFRSAVSEALWARANPAHELSGPARAFAGIGLTGALRESLRRTGEPVSGLSPDALLTRAIPGGHTTSDFPLILGDTVNRSLRTRFGAPPSGAMRVAKQKAARDFRLQRRNMLSEFTALAKIEEHGEVTGGTVSEAEETYGLETFGRRIAFTRKAIINDDLGALADIGERMATSALAFVAAQLTAKIVANPTMSDAVALFHASHANTAAAGASILADLTAARLAMRKQTGLAGELISATPRFVLVPPDLETTMEQNLAAIAATKTADANPFSNLTLIVEPRLTDTGDWYVVADPGEIDGLEYCYLEGAPGPQVESRLGWEIDGVEFKVRLDFGCGFVDWRGWYKVT